MIKIDNATTFNLDDIAIQHYNTLILVPSESTGKYHSSKSLIGRIEKQKSIDSADPIKQKFWNFILDNLQDIIIGRPNVLKSVINDIQAICGLNFFSINYTYNKAELTQFGQTIKDVFNYKLYRSKPECKEYFEKLKLSLCPYCNATVVQVIDNIDELSGNKKKLALLQLDHFYPLSRHPYLSVSFFNLIPGCSPCNAQLKGDKDFDIDTHFNPFEKDLNSYFRFKLESLLPLTKEDINFSYQNIITHPDNSLVDFKIIERYLNMSHRRDIFNLYNTLKNYSPNVRKSLRKQLVGLFTSELQLKILLKNSNIPIDVNDINNVQLGKLKRDIAIQLGVLNE